MLGKGIYSILVIFFFSSVMLYSSEYTLKQSISSDNIEVNDLLGNSLAIDGDYMAIGSTGEGGSLGAVYVFHWDGTGWNQEAKLTASSREANGAFGFWVDIEGDVIVTSDYYFSAGGTWRGGVYIYEKPSTGWEDATETALITAGDVDDNTLFGASISLNEDRLAVGRTWRDGTGSRRGAVYIYRRNGDSWSSHSEEAILTGSPVGNNIYLGYQCILTEEMLIATAIGYNADEGAAYVYYKPDSGWSDATEDELLRGGDVVSGDYYGQRIAFNGSTLVVTAPLKNEGGIDRGAAYIFEYDGDIWQETSSTIKLTASDASDIDRLGFGVALDNETVYVGAADYDGGGSNRGRVYEFRRPSSGWASMNETGSIDNPDAIDEDAFSNSMALHDEFLIVTAWLSDVYESNGGAVYAFNFFDRPFLDDLEGEANIDELEISFEIDDNNRETDFIFRYGSESGSYNYEVNLSGSPKIPGSGFEIKELILSNLEIGSWYGIVSASNVEGSEISNEISFNIRKADNDGVSIAVENSAPNGGDGNGDGILDSEQATVASFPINGSFITIEIVSGCDELREVAVWNDTESGYIFPVRAVEYKVPCESAVIKIYYHDFSDLSEYEFRKLSSRNRWFSFTNAEFSQEDINGKITAVATLQLQDGGPEDYNGEINGAIYDPGGPAILNVDANIPVWEWWWVLLLLGGGWLVWKKMG